MRTTRPTHACCCSAPHDIFHFSCTRHSLSFNNLKVEGGKAVAEALPKSSLTSLECAAGPGIHLMLSSPCVQRPVNTCTFPAPGSLSHNGLGVEGSKVVADALPKTQIKELKCACAHLTFSSSPHDILHFF